MALGLMSTTHTATVEALAGMLSLELRLIQLTEPFLI